MNNIEFVEKLIGIAKSDTVYAKGGYGQKGTDYWKNFFLSRYTDNCNNATIRNGIESATENTSFYDCNCLVKSTINGNNGYTTAPCPDIDVKSMLELCTEASNDMSKIEVGEYLVYGNYSHCGIYAGIIDGKRMAVECTQRWDNGVQLIDIDREERKNNTLNSWRYHGKLSKWITYIPTTNAATEDLKKAVNRMVKCSKGMRGDYVAAIQKALNSLGYKDVTADGIFGSITEKAVKDYQKKNQLESDGIVGVDTLFMLIGKR